MVSMDEWVVHARRKGNSEEYITNVAKRFLPIHHDVRGIVRVLVTVL